MICARVNAALDARELIDFLDYNAARANKVKGLWRCFCPIHEDHVFRTLVINPRRNTYHCEYTGCPANQPNDFIDLVARSRHISRFQAVQDLIGRFGLEKLRLTPEEGSFVDDAVAAQSNGALRREPSAEEA